MMTVEAAKVFATGVDSMGIILNGFIDWASTMLEGAEREEAFHHIVAIATDFQRLTMAIADYEGVKP